MEDAVMWFFDVRQSTRRIDLLAKFKEIHPQTEIIWSTTGDRRFRVTYEKRSL